MCKEKAARLIRRLFGTQLRLDGLNHLDELGGVRFRLTDDTDMVLAYQALGGLAFPITDEITVEAQYRYQTMTDPEFTDSLGGSFDLENDSHNLEIGLRLNF